MGVSKCDGLSQLLLTTEFLNSSKCWHLQIRRSITSPSTAIITKLGLKRGSNASKYANLWIAFFFSAMCHTFSQYLISRSEGGNILNWMSPAAAITLEDFAIEFFQRRGFMDSGKSRLLKKHFRRLIKII
jgi:hypothetical protein